MKAKAGVPEPCLAAVILEGVLSFVPEPTKWDVRNGWFNRHHTPMSQVPVQVAGQTGNQGRLYLLSDPSFLFNNLLQQYHASLTHMNPGSQERSPLEMLNQTCPLRSI